jgi:hypothetical protein
MLGQRTWDSLSFDDVIRFIGDPKTLYMGGGSEEVDLPGDLSAARYLQFARSDLRQGWTRGRVNALGNAKRALHCQVDSVLYCVGLWAHAESRGWEFTTKTDLVKELKIVAPAVLGEINRLRNKVEHEYSVPQDAEQLGSFIDVVDLFLAHANPFAHRRYELSEYERDYRGSTRGITVSQASGRIEVRIYGASRHRVFDRFSPQPLRRLQVAVYSANLRTDHYP